MNNSSIHKIEDLRKADTELLAQLLSLLPGTEPNEAWLRDQAHLISTFPASLKRPTLLPRLASALNITADKAHLCKTHKLLNGQLIRRLFLQVSAECTTRVARLSEYPMLPENVSQFLKRIHSLNSLWMSPELYRQAFKVMPHEARFEPIEGGCEACILATIGGNPQIISDLRTSMLGRKKKRGHTPRLLPLVESWIGWNTQGDEICEESDELAREVRGIRRQLQQARRQLRRNVAEGIVDGNMKRRSEPGAPRAEGETHSADFEVDDGEHANENDAVVDYYANIMSSTNLPERPQTVEGMHPAFRNSIVFDTKAGVFVSAGGKPPRQRQRPDTAYSASVYGQSARSAPSHNGGAGPTGYSEEHARAYEELTGHTRHLAISEDEEEDDDAETRAEKERMTRMSDFL